MSPAILLTLALAASNAPAHRAQDERPVLQWSETCFDAGDVPEGTVLQHAFEVRNLGTVPVLLEIRPCCGHPYYQNERVLFPGAVESITLTANTTRFRGPIVKTAMVLTDPPARHVSLGSVAPPR